MTITDDKYVQVTNGAVVERGSFKFDETKKPMTMDLSITEGDSAGQTQLGVFEVTATTMKGKVERRRRHDAADGLHAERRVVRVYGEEA